MAVTATQTLAGRSPDGSRFPALVVYSILAHLFFLVVVPVLTQLLRRPVRYERPQTFQVVRMPPPRSMPRRPVERAVEKVVEKKQPVPSAKRSEPKPAEQEPVEEKVDELASLLDGLSVPAVDVTGFPSDFKYPWYINSIRMKVEQYWKPSVEKKDSHIEVTFTIFRNGDIGEIVVVTSSGDVGLDNLAVRAVKLAAPFGKIPVGFSDDKLDVHYILRPVRK